MDSSGMYGQTGTESGGEGARAPRPSVASVAVCKAGMTPIPWLLTVLAYHALHIVEPAEGTHRVLHY
jgi:hypothetical protein